MPRPRQVVLSAMARDLRAAAERIEKAKNSDELLLPASMVSIVNAELLQVREYWRAKS